MMHSVPVLLHWVHSELPFGTTHRIRLSRHEAHATDARWRICCLVACFVAVERADTFSWFEISVGGESDSEDFFTLAAAIPEALSSSMMAVFHLGLSCMRQESYG
jgi:hypothetical protein